MPLPRWRFNANVTRGLRFRLAVSYVVFFTVLLSVVGVFFRQVLNRIQETQMRETLEEEWGAVNGYLKLDPKLEPSQHEWFYDRDDRDETAIVDRLRRVFLLTDANGKVLEASETYKDLGINSPAEIRAIIAGNRSDWQERKSSEGEPHIILSGVLTDDAHHAYFVAVGRSLASNRRTVSEFTKDYSLLLPVVILASCLLGWYVAGRALSPVIELAQATDRISSSNLSLRLPLRRAGDELDHLIQTFNLMVERLEQSFEQTRQFSTDVSHELRTPLTAIRGQLEVALFTASTIDHYREAIINALQDVERLSRTIRALLLLSQAESGQLALQKGPLDLCAVVEDIVDQFQIPAEESEISVVSDLPGACSIDADRVQIERLISNLLSNAVKYTPAGGKVVVRVRRENGSAMLDVEDTGVGIPPDNLPHIFDRFYRVPSQSREQKGLGLGLSFVAWIVKAHGGSIDVDSRPGEGTRFRIHLPAASADGNGATGGGLQPVPVKSEA